MALFKYANRLNQSKHSSFDMAFQPSAFVRSAASLEPDLKQVVAALDAPETPEVAQTAEVERVGEGEVGTF